MALIFDGEVLLRASCGDRGCIGTIVEVNEACRSLFGLFAGDDEDLAVALLVATEVVFVCVNVLVMVAEVTRDCAFLDFAFVDAEILDAGGLTYLTLLFVFAAVADSLEDFEDLASLFAFPRSLRVSLIEGRIFAGVFF